MLKFDLYTEAFRSLAVAASMLREGAADPASMLKQAPRAAALMDRAMAMLRDPRAGRQIIRVPNLASITIGAGATAPVPGNDSPLTWPNDGRVIGLRVGTATATDASNAQTSLKILTKDGQQNLFNDGNKDTFVPFGAINTVASPYWPLWVKVKRNEVWTVTPQNEALAAVAPVTVFPFVVFAFLPGRFLDSRDVDDEDED